jgi:hypothetical protein
MLTPAAEAGRDFAAVVARLKPCPDTKTEVAAHTNRSYRTAPETPTRRVLPFKGWLLEIRYLTALVQRSKPDGLTATAPARRPIRKKR